MNSNQNQELIDEIAKQMKSSLKTTILSTIVCMGPICNLIIFIGTDKTLRPLHWIITFISAIALVYLWFSHCKLRKHCLNLLKNL